MGSEMCIRDSRDDLPKRFVENPAQTAILLAAADTLDIFADGLSLIVKNEAEGSLPDITTRKGTLPMPVQGKVIRYFNEADAAGIKRPGIVVATSDNALVRTPTAATIRYRGPLLDYGLVSILEPQKDILYICLLYTSPSPRDLSTSRMPSSA